MRRGQALLAGLAALPARSLIALVRGYRFFFSPWVGQRCRFEPTCSRYALQALDRHGAVGGSLLTCGRLLRCHPWCAGGLDPVPDNAPWPLNRRAAHPPGNGGLFTDLVATDPGATAPADPTLSNPAP